MKIISNAFINEAFIPSKYTCDGMNVSPPLEWSNFPVETKCFALICNDPDAPAGDWIHWVIANIPSGVNNLAENFRVAGNPLHEPIAGINDFSKLEYGGPCPPRGIHRYYFTIYALDSFLAVKKGITASELKNLMKGHILAEGVLMGKYQRP